MENLAPNAVPDGVAMVSCPFCAEPIRAEARKCRYCGETVDVSMRKAEEALRASARPVYVRHAKSRGAAILIALFLGGIGGHKFYLGQAGLGILYLLFCWTFIPSIIALIELIIYACMSEDDFHAKYG
ncbi:TM2 domain-containing protein [Novosphingobium clariflavum]|uniref:NINE protein n=1 Tax=Novosphingobium clariflavum TaxID=2029884 RepID=A0ABV6S601_9SPHN|nr:TM2 domain-containing protein [Novosphingobium clariflavum]